MLKTSRQNDYVYSMCGFQQGERSISGLFPKAKLGAVNLLLIVLFQLSGMALGCY